VLHSYTLCLTHKRTHRHTNTSELHLCWTGPAHAHCCRTQTRRLMHSCTFVRAHEYSLHLWGHSTHVWVVATLSKSWHQTGTTYTQHLADASIGNPRITRSNRTEHDITWLLVWGINLRGSGGSCKLGTADPDPHIASLTPAKSGTCWQSRWQPSLGVPRTIATDWSLRLHCTPAWGLAPHPRLHAGKAKQELAVQNVGLIAISSMLVETGTSGRIFIVVAKQSTHFVCTEGSRSCQSLMQGRKPSAAGHCDQGFVVSKAFPLVL